MRADLQQQKALALKALDEHAAITVAGCLNIAKTLKNAGLQRTSTLWRLVRVEAIRRGMPLIASPAARLRRVGRVGMPFGPKTGELTLEQVRVPAVYEVVCGPTGRRYVGSSGRPDLRRSVHLHWLKNLDKPGRSNIFMCNDAIRSDVEEHGPDSFYLEVVMQFDRWTSREELNLYEVDYIRSLDPSLLYNIQHVYGGDSRRQSRVKNPEWVASWTEWKNAITAVRSFSGPASELTAIRERVREARVLKKSLPMYVRTSSNRQPS